MEVNGQRTESRTPFKLETLEKTRESGKVYGIKSRWRKRQKEDQINWTIRRLSYAVLDLGLWSDVNSLQTCTPQSLSMIFNGEDWVPCTRCTELTPAELSWHWQSFLFLVLLMGREPGDWSCQRPCLRRQDLPRLFPTHNFRGSCQPLHRHRCCSLNHPSQQAGSSPPTTVLTSALDIMSQRTPSLPKMLTNHNTN